MAFGKEGNYELGSENLGPQQGLQFDAVQNQPLGTQQWFPGQACSSLRAFALAVSSLQGTFHLAHSITLSRSLLRCNLLWETFADHPV